ncbi:hypothetical protein N9K76_04790, partial [Aquiluna sp.]|nr:hypothetical protein [Aquiluna sp.]
MSISVLFPPLRPLVTSAIECPFAIVRSVNSYGFFSADPLASDFLTFEDIAGNLEPGIELSNAPWDPWNDLSA